MPHALERKVKDRLYDLSPRAFEFFAGDLLAFMGLDSVVVTRQSGDDGIDAHCNLVSGGILRVPAGVQVKKWRQPVSRPKMDHLAGHLPHGRRSDRGPVATSGLRRHWHEGVLPPAAAQAQDFLSRSRLT